MMIKIHYVWHNSIALKDEKRNPDNLIPVVTLSELRELLEKENPQMFKIVLSRLEKEGA
jgi:flagellar motor switch protein FliG